jgi:protein-disulfide isomerase
VKQFSLLALLSISAIAGCATQTHSAVISATQADAILSELHDIKQLVIEQQAAAKKATAPEVTAPVRFHDLGNDSLGAADAPVILFEFADYQCPFCRRFHENSFPELKAKYIDTGKVRYVVRDMPLTFHDNAMPAAIATRCASAQGKFWPVFEALFAAPTLTPELAHRVALQAGVDAKRFDTCISDLNVRKAIEADLAEADRMGVTGTPGFIIAEQDGAELVGSLVLGAQPAAVFGDKIDALLAARNKRP